MYDRKFNRKSMTFPEVSEDRAARCLSRFNSILKLVRQRFWNIEHPDSREESVLASQVTEALEEGDDEPCESL